MEKISKVNASILMVLMVLGLLVGESSVFGACGVDCAAACRRSNFGCMRVCLNQCKMAAASLDDAQKQAQDICNLQCISSTCGGSTKDGNCVDYCSQQCTNL